jgi:hypothetical protein
VSCGEIVAFAALPDEKLVAFSSMIDVQVPPLGAVTFVHLPALALVSPLESFGWLFRHRRARRVE